MGEFKFVKGVRALGRSFGYAFAGIGFAFQTQRNAKLHVLAAVVVTIVGGLLGLKPDDWRWLCACIALVWFAEMMNTAFEYVCDVVSPDLHVSVKRAKDIAAGAVLICSIGAAIIGMLTLWPYLMKPL